MLLAKKKHTYEYKNKIQIAKRELNKVSKAVMCEVMLDIQMIVPTGRPMGDGGGSESSLFQNLYIRVGKDKHTQSGWLREGLNNL